MADFLHATHRGGLLLRKHHFGKALRELSRGLELWRGDAFSEFADAEMLRPVANSLERARTAALERWAEAKMCVGQPNDVPAVLSGHIQRDPLNENLRVQMMRALAVTGKQAEALQLYRDTRTLLVEQLGIEPGAQLRAAHDSILRGESQMSAAALR